MNTFGYVGGNPVLASDPTGLFTISSSKLPGAYFGGRRIYTFDFTGGCIWGWIEDKVNPSKRLRIINGVRKKSRDFTSGEGDVPPEDLCKCRDMDPEFEKIYRGMGHSIRASLSRAQAAAVLTAFRAFVRDQDEDECSDCKDVYDAYPWTKLLDLADDRSLPSAGDMMNELSK